MKRALALGVVVVAASSCLSLVNNVKFVPAEGAPAVESRPGGCTVEVVRDGDETTRAHTCIGRIAVVWSKDRLAEQGEAGAEKSLKEAACERGGHILKDLRMQNLGGTAGFEHSAQLCVHVDDQGRPVNAAGPPAVAPADAGPG